MGASGTTTIDFGTFPGTNQASVAVSQPTILGSSLTEAWLYPLATADHSSDEHLCEPIDVKASIPTAGVGFTVTATARDNPAGELPQGGRSVRGLGSSVRDSIRLYGLWTVAWVWN